ncbi:Tfp pilus assembly protein FimT/FimU [Pseudomonas sp. No.117]
MHSRASRGITLVELLVVIALVAIVASFAAPSFTGSLRSNRVTAALSELNGLFQYARAEALTRAASIAVARAGDTWNVTSGSQTLRQVTLSGVTVATNTANVTLRANGTLNTNLVALLCADNQAAGAQKLLIDRTGRSRTPAQGKDEDGKALTQCTL